MVISKNIVRTAVASCSLRWRVSRELYFLLNAEFLAAVQLVVYAGGTLILIIFGVMLTSKGPFTHFEAKLGEVIIALSLGTIVLFALSMAILRTNFTDELLAAGPYPIDRLGQVLLGDYLVPFEIISVLLLAVMIGAAYLAKGRRREGDAPTPTRASSGVLSKQAREWT